MNHIYNITSPLTGGSHYGNKGFASPMKELNEQTVLVENCENKNDSYRQKTKYDDKTDSYYSTLTAIWEENLRQTRIPIIILFPMLKEVFMKRWK